MEENKVPSKPTYEELEKAIEIRNSQLQEMYRQLQEATSQNVIIRLQFLFDVIKNSDKFSTQFVAKCVTEIEETLTIPEENTTNVE